MLSRLIGTWRGPGRGEYPTIEPFTYTEEVVLSDPGRTFLTYSQRTWAADGTPKHAETGFVRAVSAERAEWVIVSPTGVLESLVARPQLDGPALVLDFAAEQVVITATAKSVTGTWRRLRITDASLDYSMDMAAVGLGRTFHLAASLVRIAPS